MPGLVYQLSNIIWIVVGAIRHISRDKCEIVFRTCSNSINLEAFCAYLERTKPDANIIHINFNLLEFEELLNYKEEPDMPPSRTYRSKAS